MPHTSHCVMHSSILFNTYDEKYRDIVLNLLGNILVVTDLDAGNRISRMINNTYIRVVDDSTKREICRYNLTDNYPNMTHVIFGDLHKDKNGEWQFRAIGEGTKDDNVVALANRFVS